VFGWSLRLREGSDGGQEKYKNRAFQTHGGKPFRGPMRSCQTKNIAAREDHKILFLAASIHFLARFPEEGK
jgi:hypothetical protein